jgi:PIN domain nuclease of toxin-antitoxin system
MGAEESVPVGVRRELADPRTEVFYSQISLWEIQIKYQIGKLSMKDEPAVIMPRELERYSFTRLDLTDAAIFALSRLPPLHRDPFDRMLIAQAKMTGSTLISPDKVFSQYPINVRWGDEA